MGYAAEYPIMAFARPNKSRFSPMFIVLIIPYQDFFCLSFLSLPNVRSLQFAKVKTDMATALTLAKTYQPQNVSGTKSPGMWYNRAHVNKRNT